MPLTVLAEEETTTAIAESEERDWDYGGLVLLSNSVGRGTFIGDEFNARPSWNMLLSVRPKFTISKKHNLIIYQLKEIQPLVQYLLVHLY